MSAPAPRAGAAESPQADGRWIPESEVVFHDLSFADPHGRLFSWQGELYRALSAEASGRFRDLFRRGILEELTKAGLLIETYETELRLEGYDLVVRHRRLPFVTYAFEWPTEMLRAAGLHLCDLLEALAPHGLTLQDAHPWNIVWDGTQAWWVDLGSIIPCPSAKPWPAHRQMDRFFFHPLALAQRGQVRLVRWLLRDFDRGVQASEVALLAPRPWFRRLGDRIRDRVRRGRRRLGLGSAPTDPAAVLERRRAFLGRLRRRLEALELQDRETTWSDYYDERFPPFETSPEWNEKHRGVEAVLRRARPETVLDIGSNRGWYAQLAAHLGSRVVALDTDEAAANRLFADVRASGLSVLPSVIDFRNPSPAYGLDNRWLAPATRRLRCEMVFALALLHHLVFRHHLSFEAIVGALARVTDSWLLVEYIPLDDQHVAATWNIEGYDWYTLERLKGALEAEFEVVEVLPSAPAPRVLLFCRRRKP